jgi:hypothetical protein
MSFLNVLQDVMLAANVDIEELKVCLQLLKKMLANNVSNYLPYIACIFRLNTLERTIRGVEISEKELRTLPDFDSSMFNISLDEN